MNVIDEGFNRGLKVAKVKMEPYKFDPKIIVKELLYHSYHMISHHPLQSSINCLNVLAW